MPRLPKLFTADGLFQTTLFCKTVGAKLSSHTFQSISTSSLLSCASACAANTECLSANYDISTCDFNMVEHTSYLAIGNFNEEHDTSKVFIHHWGLCLKYCTCSYAYIHLPNYRRKHLICVSISIS